MTAATVAEAPDVASETRPARVGHAHLWLLLALTAFGGVLRFMYLDRPVFWIDEAFTYWRVSGDYAHLRSILREGGFTPLHYQIIWVLGQCFDLSPFVLRLVPAVCGTLMVPAMYFLARQLASRRVALATAAFAACSAYLLNYSRDAKMYMDLWLFMTLHVACLLWWLRVRSTTAWLCWVAAGLAMAGVHGTGMIVMALEPIVLLTARDFRWWLAPLFLAGLLVVAAGPVGYYKFFNRWNENIEQVGWGRGSGLGWVDWYNAGRTGVDRLRFPASAFLFNWEWPKDLDERRVDPRVMAGYTRAATALAALAAAGLFPWPVLMRRLTGKRRVAAWLIGFDARAADAAAPPEPWWRSAFWVLLWVVLPPYALHCTGQRGFVSPADWLYVARDWWAHGPWWASAVMVGVPAAAFAALWAGGGFAAALKKSAQLLLVLAGVFAACWVVANGFEMRLGSVWVTRYLAVAWPAFALALCALLMRLPGWPLRGAALALLLGLNLVNFYARLTHHTEPPLDRIAADAAAGRSGESGVLTFLGDTAANEGIMPAGGLLHPSGRYYLCRAAGVRIEPNQFLVSNFNFDSGPFERAMQRQAGLTFRTNNSPAAVRRELSRSPHVRTVIVWERVRSRTPAEGKDGDEGPADPLLEALGAGWRRAADDRYDVYNNFTWRWDQAYRRREYVFGG